MWELAQQHPKELRFPRKEWISKYTNKGFKAYLGGLIYLLEDHFQPEHLMTQPGKAFYKINTDMDPVSIRNLADKIIMHAMTTNAKAKPLTEQQIKAWKIIFTYNQKHLLTSNKNRNKILMNQ